MIFTVTALYTILNNFFYYNRLVLYPFVLLVLLRCLFIIVNHSDLPAHTSTAAYGWILLYGLRSDLLVGILVALPVMLLALAVRKKNAGLYGRLLLWLYVVMVLALLLPCIFDIFYFYSNHRRLALADLAVIKTNRGLLLPYLKKYWYLLLLLLLLTAGSFLIARNWLLRVEERRYTRVWSVSLLVFYGLLLFLLGYDSKTGYFFTTSSGYFVMKGGQVPFSANTITELLASRRYNQIKPEQWRFMPDAEAFALHPVIQKIKNNQANKKNIILFIIESASQEDFMPGPTRRQVLPFLDSLMDQSLVFDNFFANGLASPAGLDAIIGGIPEGVTNDFFLTGYGYNQAQWFTSVLKAHQYNTYFFYGVHDFSQSFLKNSKNYQLDHDFGYREYHASKKDFDYYYGIYDDVFFPAIAGRMAHIDTPFASVIYNVSTHGPFNLLPAAVIDTIPDFGKSNRRSLRYYDNVMRRFFSSIYQQPWFSNTIFVFAADHFSRATDRADKTVIGNYKIPMFIYAPDGSYKGHATQVAQQIDIPVTVLELTGMGGDFFSFGRSVLDTTGKRVVFNKFGNLLQAIDDEYLLQYNFNTRQVEALYAYKKDSALIRNLSASLPKETAALLTQLQAFWQVYAVSLSQNRMHPDKFIKKQN